MGTSSTRSGLRLFAYLLGSVAAASGCASAGDMNPTASGTPSGTGMSPNLPASNPGAAPGALPGGAASPGAMASGGPSTPEGNANPIGVVGGANTPGGMGTAPPSMPAASVDCSLAGSAPVSIAWNAVNRQDPAWYATPEALTLAENVVYYQNADRGWPKGIEMTTRTAALDPQSTIDNNATTTQIDILARVYTASGCTKYGDAARQGINYLLEAQYDNGGWPQRYPDPQGYPAHITFNDNAIVHVLDLLRDVSRRAERFAFADDALVASAAAAVERGVGCILATQVEMNGEKTGWCAQHDEVTLAPAQARTYELPSLSGSEGAALFRFLMSIENPSPEMREAVIGAATWFEQVKLTGIRIESVTDATQPTGQDRVVVQDPAAPPLWARFYELGTNRPIFSSRCEVPECEDDPYFMRRYSLAEIDNERRTGYSWYGNWPAQLLATTYPAWRAQNIPGG